MTSQDDTPILTNEYLDEHKVQQEPADDYAELGRSVARLALQVAKAYTGDGDKTEISLALPFWVKSVPGSQTANGRGCCFILTQDGTSVHVPC